MLRSELRIHGFFHERFHVLIILGGGGWIWIDVVGVYCQYLFTSLVGHRWKTVGNQCSSTGF